jgi:NAD(P)-dependent dehydrogenase (short-subunit alcohol dehydrogenase family)
VRPRRAYPRTLLRHIATPLLASTSNASAMPDMTGKTILITGANQGIGKASAMALGKMGARLVLVCRNETKAREAIVDIEKAGAKNVELIVGNLGSQADVRRIAAEFVSSHDVLDVLMNNAGLLVPSRRTTVDGIEETLAINHLAPFLLTSLLLDVLKKTPRARIVNVSSRAHRGARMHWDDLQLTRGYSANKAYGQSKLCNILFTRELAKRLESTGVTANSLHPGVIASGFGHTYGGAISVVLKVVKPFLGTPEEGAKTQVWLASSPDVEGITGKYFEKCAEAKPSRRALEDGAPARLWEISEKRVGIAKPSV